MKKLLSILPIIFCALTMYGQSMSVNVSGNVNFNNLQYNISEAGEDFSPSLENESSMYINIEYSSVWEKWFNPNRKWKMNIHKTDINWNTEIKIEARRTGNGNRPWYRNGSVNINDGTTYQSITNTPTYFFRGKDEILNIPLAINLSGISLIMGAQNFETNIILTVYDD